MPRRLIAVSLVTVALLACASIDPPASFTKPEAGVDPFAADAGPFDRCRVLSRVFATNAEAKIYGAPSGAQAICVSLYLPVPAAGSGAVVFCVAGDLDTVNLNAAHDLTPDLRTCAYCADVQTNCVDAGTDASAICGTSYAPLSGQARIVRLGRAAGEPVWIDIGDLVVARVTRRDDGTFDLERRDCIFADGLTIQGVLASASATACTGLESTACSIANTASSRFP